MLSGLAAALGQIEEKGLVGGKPEAEEAPAEPEDSGEAEAPAEPEGAGEDEAGS
jgi:hypothetical protein